MQPGCKERARQENALYSRRNRRGHFRERQQHRTTNALTSWLNALNFGIVDMLWYTSVSDVVVRNSWASGRSPGLTLALVVPGARVPFVDADVTDGPPSRVEYGLNRGGRFRRVRWCSTVGSCGTGAGGRPVVR